MAKLVNYTCTVCGYDIEDLFNDTDEILEDLDEICDECDSIGTFHINNVKNNEHRWDYNDRGGEK